METWNYLNLPITLSTSLSGFPQEVSPSIVFPQKPQEAPSLLRKGLWEAQVPLNSPFLRKMSLTDIKTKNSATKPNVNNTVVITDKFAQI